MFTNTHPADTKLNRMNSKLYQALLLFNVMKLNIFSPSLQSFWFKRDVINIVYFMLKVYIKIHF